MLWLPKYLHDQGEQLEDARPSRRAFLFVAAATVVVPAVAPTPPAPDHRPSVSVWWDEMAPFTSEQREWLLANGSRMLFQGGRRGGRTAALHALMRAEADQLAVDPAGVHGMVNHQGLIVPKYAPQESWQSQFLGHFEPRWREPAECRVEFLDASGKPAGWVKADPEKPDAHAATWHWRAVRRRTW